MKRLAKKIENALVGLTLAALKQVGAEDKIKNLEVLVKEETRRVLEEKINDKRRNPAKNY